jgi:acyl-CoA synthetase (AMP-forming)/AMP-acid ligase II
LIISKVSLPDLEESVKAELSKIGYASIVVEDIPDLPTLYPKLGRDNDAETTNEDTFKLAPQDLDTTALILHSSGSTGMPKPIYQKYHFHATAAHARKLLYFAADMQTPFLIVELAAMAEITELLGGKVRLAGMHLPPFHVLGNYMLVRAPPLLITYPIKVMAPTARSANL